MSNTRLKTLEKRPAVHYNISERQVTFALWRVERCGENFKRQFDTDSYEKFFEKMGYENVTYEIIRGKMSCDIAVIEVNKKNDGNYTVYVDANKAVGRLSVETKK